MEANFQRELTMELLADRAGMSVRNFDRRFRAAVAEAPSSYLQKLRIEKAKRLLESTHDAVAEIMIKVGYADERSFRRLFHALTDFRPRPTGRNMECRQLRSRHRRGALSKIWLKELKRKIKSLFGRTCSP